MKEYIGEIIGACAVIIAAIIGLFAKNKNSNKQSVNKADNSNVFQANGTININQKRNNSNTSSDQQ